MIFREHRLANGLEIIAECNEDAYSTALAFFVNTGSRDETADIAGVSHFLEHMVFKGTPRRSAADVNRELDELGSHSNAYTSEEQTVYYATVLPEYQLAVVELLADVMRPSLRLEDFETEKQVIVEEILKYDDQPPYGAHEKCMAAFFDDHPLGQSVLGSIDTVKALSPQAMRDYFDERYSPANMTLVATGNVDFDALIRSAEQHCGSWQRFNTKRTSPTYTPSTGVQTLTQPSATQQYAVLISSAPAADDPLRYAARLLSMVIGDDSGSRFYWDLVDTGLVEYAAATTYEFDGAGIVMSFLSCAPSDAEENLDRLAQIQHEIQSGGITADELELAKSKICSQIVRRGERPGNRLFTVGNAWLHRRQYRQMRELVDAFQAVNLDAIRTVLEQHPLTETMCISVGP